MPSLTEVECPQCLKKFKRESKYVKYNASKGVVSFCSNQCATRYRALPPPSVRNCEFCGKVFLNTGQTRERRRRFCSRGCASSGSVTPKRSQAAKRVREQTFGPSHPSIDKNCKKCNKSFTVKYGRRYQKYCSLSCGISGVALSRPKNPPVILTCLGCNKQFTPPYGKRNIVKHCSFDCFFLKKYGYTFGEAKSLRARRAILLKIGRGAYQQRCKNCDKEFGSRYPKVYCGAICLKEGMSRNASERIKNGKSACGRSKKLVYTSPISGQMTVDGTWEYKFCEWADKNNVLITNKTGYFSYVYKNCKRKYYPDFCLTIENNTWYIEVKGEETLRDRAKWEYFPKNLIILRKEQIKKLNEFSVSDLRKFQYNKYNLPPLKYLNAKINS